MVCTSRALHADTAWHDSAQTTCGTAWSRSGSGGSLVDVVQAVEDRPGDHLPVGLPRARHGSLQSERSVGSVLVVVTHKLGQDRSDMPLAQWQDVVQALAA